MYVRLAGDWTGPDRVRHGAGEFVEVDNVTLAELEAEGYVVAVDDDVPVAGTAARVEAGEVTSTPAS